MTWWMRFVGWMDYWLASPRVQRETPQPIVVMLVSSGFFRVIGICLRRRVKINGYPATVKNVTVKLHGWLQPADAEASPSRTRLYKYCTMALLGEANWSYQTESGSKKDLWWCWVDLSLSRALCYSMHVRYLHLSLTYCTALNCMHTSSSTVLNNVILNC